MYEGDLGLSQCLGEGNYMSHTVTKCPPNVSHNPSPGKNEMIPTFARALFLSSNMKQFLTGGALLGDRLRGKMRLDVKCVITATLICPQGGGKLRQQHIGRDDSQRDSLHKKALQGMCSYRHATSGRLPRQQCPAVATEHQGFFAHQGKYASYSSLI